MTRLTILFLVISGCATTDDPIEDEGGVDDVATESAETSTTEAQAPSTTSPSIVRGGSSDARVIASVAGGYAGLELDGGTELGAFAIATYYPASTSGDVAAAFTVTPDPGSAFIYSLKGTGTGYAYTHLRIERAPGSTDLRAATTTGIVTCGTVPSGTATAIGISLATAAKRFSITIDGAPTACTNLTTKLGAPITGFEMMDASNAGYGGVVRFGGLAFP